MLFAFVSLSILLMVGSVRGYPGGAPTGVCESMRPSHGVAEQTTPSLFEISARRNGDTYMITIESSAEVPFHGFMLQARTPDDRVIGIFEPSATHMIKTINCGSQNNTLTHTNKVDKPIVEVTWNPNGYEGLAYFTGTVVQDYSTFWLNVRSQRMQISPNQGTGPTSSSTFRTSSTTEPYFSSTTNEPATEFDPVYEGCGKKKTCFGQPEGCIDRKNCKAVAAVSVYGDRYEFELKAEPGVQWVGLGLSDDSLMGDDSVLECVNDPAGVKAYLSYTVLEPKADAIRDRNQDSINLLQSSADNGAIYCRIFRETRITTNNKVFDLAKDKYYLLLAAGSSVENRKVGFHDVLYKSSGDSIFLSEISAIEAASDLFVRLHGAFMLTAWIGTASVGMLLARYFRQTWVGSQLCGKDQWFAWHRFFMVLTWCLTMVAFVLIFLELRAWSSARNPHAILGTVTTALCFFQPIGAYFRPHPGTKNRWMFNWGHWFLGNAAHIIAIVTIFYAVQLTKAQLPEFMNYILAGYVSFHVIIHLILSVLGFCSERSADRRINSIPMKEMGGSGRSSMYNDQRSEDAPKSGCRKIFLGIYILIVTLFTAGLVFIAAAAPIEEFYENNIKTMINN